MSQGGPTSTTTSALPEYIQPYISNLLQGAQQNFYSEYTPYSGPRIAEQSPLYMYGAEQLVNNQASPYTDMAGAGAAGAYDTLTDRLAQPGWMGTAGPFETSAWGGPAASGGQWTGGAAPTDPGWLAQNGNPTTDVWGSYNFTEPSWTDAGVANAYMNPYTQGVLDIQRREANLAADQALEKYRSGAASRGAFGGSRSAILESEMNRNRLQNLSDIEATGLNTAYNAGMGQFNTENAGNRALLGMGLSQFNADEARQLATWQAGAGQSNAERGQALQSWLANTGQFNADQARGLQAWQANTGQFNADANRAMQAWQANAAQTNAEMGQALQGASTQQGLAGLLGSLGAQDFGQNRQVIQDIMNVGLTEEGRRQRELDMDYADFIDQRDYPTKQLDAYRALIYGAPITPQTATSQAPPNWLTQMAGVGSLLWGGTGATK